MVASSFCHARKSAFKLVSQQLLKLCNIFIFGMAYWFPLGSFDILVLQLDFLWDTENFTALLSSLDRENVNNI